MAHKTGIIGLGIMGRRMLEHMARHPEFTPTALWDPSADACAAATALNTGAEIAQDASAVISACDVVYLACPPAPRKAFALQAAQQGKAILLEKPLGIDVAESRELVAQLEASGVPAAVNFTQAAGAALATITGDGAMGPCEGVDIVVTYPTWPRAWQKDADWLRFNAEGGYTREVISHFIFFSSRVLGPLTLVHAKADYPSDPTLCETHVTARLQNANGVPVTILGSVGGVQPDRQEMTIKGANHSYRVSEFYILSKSEGGPFQQQGDLPEDPRAVSLKGQLDQMHKAIQGQAHLLSTPAEALMVQEIVEAMLAK